MFSADVEGALAKMGVSPDAIALLARRDPNLIAALNAIAALANPGPATSSLDSALMPGVTAAEHSVTLEPGLMAQWETIKQQLGRGILPQHDGQDVIRRVISKIGFNDQPSRAALAIKTFGRDWPHITQPPMSTDDFSTLYLNVVDCAHDLLPWRKAIAALNEKVAPGAAATHGVLDSETVDALVGMIPRMTMSEDAKRTLLISTGLNINESPCAEIARTPGKSDFFARVFDELVPYFTRKQTLNFLKMFRCYAFNSNDRQRLDGIIGQFDQS
jgi:hypothetical protein